MIRIYYEQINTYQRHLNNRLSIKILAFVREECSKELDRISDSAVLYWIDDGIQKAQSYQLESEYSIGLFVSLLIKIGFAFDKQIAIQEILQKSHLTDNQRVDLVIKTTTEHQWKLAQSLAE